jgi:hypothetical protein
MLQTICYTHRLRENVACSYSSSFTAMCSGAVLQTKPTASSTVYESQCIQWFSGLMCVWSAIVSLITFNCMWYHKLPSFYTCCNTKNILLVSDYRNTVVSEFRTATIFCSIFVLLPHTVGGRRIWKGHGYLQTDPRKREINLLYKTCIRMRGHDV